jgi:hypothetical protein
MSNRLKNIIKQNVSNLLSEDVFGKHNDAKTISKSGSVTHDKVATHSAKASIVIDKIKDNLRSMGVSASDVDGIYTIDQLKSKPFDIKFTVLGKENKWGERKKKDISTKAKYNKPLSESRGTMVLDLKDYGTMVFLKKHLNMNLPGTDKTLKGLANGKNYRVQSLNGVLAIKLNEQGGQKDSTHVIELHDINLDGGGEPNKSKDDIAVGSFKIHRDSKNPDWFTDEVEGLVNTQLKVGVKFEKSQSLQDGTIVLSWSKIGNSLGQETQAMLIRLVNKPEDTFNKLMGTGINGDKVHIGRKVGGKEGFNDDAVGTIFLKVKK